MERFATDWLALREPLDARSRSRPLARAFLRAVRRGGRIADLGAGRGANAVYLAALGRRDLRWLLVDGDRRLLEEAVRRLPRAETLCGDLASRRTLSPLRRCDAVAASALGDLVSSAWLARLVREMARRRLPFLLALTVDGRMALHPADPLDETVLGAFRRDQRRDKGFGPALGPDAPRVLVRMLRRHSYRVRTARTDWTLASDDAAALRAFVAGMAAVDPARGARWLASRQRQGAAGRLAVRVGHLDILALPPGGGAVSGSRPVTLP